MKQKAEKAPAIIYYILLFTITLYSLYSIQSILYTLSLLARARALVKTEATLVPYT